jgi:hypothetical protein
VALLQTRRLRFIPVLASILESSLEVPFFKADWAPGVPIAQVFQSQDFQPQAQEFQAQKFQTRELKSRRSSIPPPPEVPLCGFEFQLPSSFHFGGTPPPVPLHSSSDAELPKRPPPSNEPGQGLPRLDKPDFEGTQAQWLCQIDRLASLPGVDTALLHEVRGMISHGVRAKFKDTERPPPRHYANTGTFDQHRGECMERMRYYEDLGALTKLSEPPPPGGYTYIQPLHAIIKPGKKARVCVDLSRNLNDFLEDTPFQYSSVREGVDLADQCPSPAYMVKLDISACFLSFPIHPDDLEFFVCQAGGDFYQFLRMVFGLKTAPRIASLLLDVVSSALADQGIAHVRYLDDFLLVASSAQRAWLCAYLAAETLVTFGLALAPDKVEGPLTCLEFLGIVIDSELRTLSISSARHEELMALLKDFLKRRWSSVRRLQSLLGKLTFASTVLPGARPFTRRIIDRICDRGDKKRIALDDAFRADVRYWATHLAQWNGKERWRAPTSTPFVFGSDASTAGFAFGLESCPEEAMGRLPLHRRPGHISCGLWSAENGDAARQSTSAAIQWGEFFCPLAAAVAYGPLLANAHVVFVIDNNSDVSVINRLRSREPRVAALLRALCDAARVHNFSFSAVHRAGDKNTLMDWASRPDLHRFRGSPSAFEDQTPAVAGGGGGVGVAVVFPPLTSPISLTYINSRCLTLRTVESSASWTSTSGGWRATVAPSTSRRRPAELTESTKQSFLSSVGPSI